MGRTKRVPTTGEKHKDPAHDRADNVLVKAKELKDHLDDHNNDAGPESSPIGVSIFSASENPASTLSQLPQDTKKHVNATIGRAVTLVETARLDPGIQDEDLSSSDVTPPSWRLSPPELGAKFGLSTYNTNGKMENYHTRFDKNVKSRSDGWESSSQSERNKIKPQKGSESCPRVPRDSRLQEQRKAKGKAKDEAESQADKDYAARYFSTH